MAPRLKVCIASDGSIGDTVEPEICHWIKWATIKAVKRISAPARQRLILEWGIFAAFFSVFGRTGRAVDRRPSPVSPVQLLLILKQHDG